MPRGREQTRGCLSKTAHVHWPCTQPGWPRQTLRLPPAQAYVRWSSAQRGGRNGSDVRSIRRRSEAQGLNVLSCETKVRKLFIIERSEPRPDALLPGIVVSLNKSAHQARSGFQVLGRARGHASPQKLKVHDRLLFFLQRETEARTRAGGRTSSACGALRGAQDALCRARRACTFERSCAPAFNLAENSVTSGGDGLSFPRARLRRLGDAAWLRKY